MTRPNVLMVLADQHNADWLGCAGHSQVQTPRLDSFATSGVRCTHAYCQNPICTPSRVSILSGQYCHNHGYYGLSGPAPQHLPNAFSHFREHGYRTAAFGKLHLPESPRNWIADDVDRFGDTYETIDGHFGHSAYFDELEKAGLRDREDSWHNHTGRYAKKSIGRDARPSDMPLEHTQEVWCAREAMAFMADGDQRPFFLQVAFQKPHHPLLPTKAFWDLYPDDLDLPPTFEQDTSHRSPVFQRMWQSTRDLDWDYAQPDETYVDGARRAWHGTLACVSQVDHVFGTLLDFLDAQGLADNTIVIYGSDHGAFHGVHGLPEKHPGICSEAVCRVPMIWRVPGQHTAGQDCNQLVENVDISPTLAALCQLPPMDWADGSDISRLLAGDERPIRSAAFSENPMSKSLRFGRYRMTYYPEAVFQGEYHGELYDLEADPDETVNLYDSETHRDVRQQGHQLLMDWLIASQRVVTCHPTIYEGAKQDGKRTYPLAGDLRAPTHLQPAQRLADPTQNIRA